MSVKKSSPGRICVSSQQREKHSGYGALTGCSGSQEVEGMSESDPGGCVRVCVCQAQHSVGPGETADRKPTCQDGLVHPESGGLDRR